MKLTQIEFEMGMTQNLGDYTNTRPSVKFFAEVGEDEDPDDVLDALQARVVRAIHNLVDDELEAVGKQVKYHDGLLYATCYSDIRKCIVVYPVGAKAPDEKNWQHSDRWSGRIHGRDYPSHMRLHTAMQAADHLHDQTGFIVYHCTDGDMSFLPPLPDAGPEPVWHQKGLQQQLQWLRIDESLWEELAVLPHVSVEYLREVYNRLNIRGEIAAAFIRENSLFEFEDFDDDEDDEDDED